MNKILSYIKIFFTGYLAFLKSDVFSLEYNNKNTITKLRFALSSHALVIAFVVLFFNAFFRYYSGEHGVIIYIDLISGVFFFLLFIWFLKSKDIRHISVLIPSLMVVMGITLLASKHTESTIYIWTYTIPMTAIFVGGYKKGFTLSMAFYTFAAVDFWLYYDTWVDIGWDFSAMIRFFITSLILVELCTIGDFISCNLQNSLYKISSTDSLTNLYNRQKIEEILQEQVEFSKRYNQNFSFCIFDIDDFKQINDKYGHLQGDKVLIQMSQIIQQKIRVIDKVGRWGGEEFMLILPNTDIKTASLILKRLKTIIAEHNFGIEQQVTCSFGLSLYNLNLSNDENIILVDNLLYDAKNTGKDKICYL